MKLASELRPAFAQSLGMTSAEIAKELYLSPCTVEAHITSIYHKLGVTSRAAATRFAIEHGLA
jgi:DNA-binding NarL/FixJ family response regulator